MKAHRANLLVCGWILLVGAPVAEGALLKVPVALKDTADNAFDLTALPPGWQLQSKDDGVNVEYLIRNLGFSIFIR
jgi:hypothetical protein